MVSALELVIASAEATLKRALTPVERKTFAQVVRASEAGQDASSLVSRPRRSARTRALAAMALLFGTLDAYRHAFDLPFNAVPAGANSAGMSFVCEVIREMRVTGTVEKLDEKTSRAPPDTGTRQWDDRDS